MIKNHPAPFLPNEEKRIQKLMGYNIVDSVPEKAFDELTELASQICNTPIALVSLVLQDRQWFKSKVGLESPETSRDASFCAHAMLNKDKSKTL